MTAASRARLARHLGEFLADQVCAGGQREAAASGFESGLWAAGWLGESERSRREWSAVRQAGFVLCNRILADRAAGVRR